MIGTTVLLSCHQIGEALVPVVIGAAISRSIATGSVSELWIWLTVLAVDFAFLSWSYRFGARLAISTRERMAHRLRMEFSRRVLAPAGGVDSAPGELVHRATSDVGRVTALAPMFGSTVAAVGVLVFSTVLLLRYSLLLGGIILVGTAVLVAIIAALAGRFGVLSEAEQRATTHAAVLTEDFLRGIRVLAGVGARRTAARYHDEAARVALTAGVRAASGEGLRTALAVLFTGLYLATIAGVGGVLALRGSLDLGSLVASLGLAQFLIGPLQVLAGSVSSVSRGLASAERIRSVLRQPPAVTEPEAPAPVVPGDIVVQGVPIPGWGELDLTVKDGALTGVVVEDAGAAAVLCRLLARESDPAAGTISLGGGSIAAVGLDTLRAVMLVSPHESRLFEGTVTQNVGTGGGAVDSDAAISAALADEVLASLPHGASTDVGADGLRLSGGQRQRIALARALAASPPVLVLHDPTTAVDAATENVIAARLRAFRTGRTTVVVSTSPALLRHCDDVAFLRPEGVVRGRHDELSLTCSDYRQLVHR